MQTAMAMVTPARLRYVFAAKSIIGPIAGFAMLGWYVRKSGGALYQGSSTVHGAPLVFVWLSSMNSSAGSYSTLSVNIADFTRYAKSPRQQYVQLLAIPAFFTLTALMGLYIASGAAVVYGGAVDFNPLTIMDHWTNRAALFFVGFAFTLCNMAGNISANSLSASNDWVVLFPKYMNIRRGGFVTSFLGCWAMCPWKVLASAGSFLSFMGGYVIFMAPICATLIADYWFIKRQRVDIPALYDPHSRYRYWKGWNWRAYATLICSVVPVFPGFVNSINPSIPLSLSMQRFYTVAWIYGTISALLVYTTLSLLFPPKETFVPETIHHQTLSETPSIEEEKRLDEPTVAVLAV